MPPAAAGQPHRLSRSASAACCAAPAPTPQSCGQRRRGGSSRWGGCRLQGKRSACHGGAEPQRAAAPLQNQQVLRPRRTWPSARAGAPGPPPCTWLGCRGEARRRRQGRGGRGTSAAGRSSRAADQRGSRRSEGSQQYSGGGGSSSSAGRSAVRRQPVGIARVGQQLLHDGAALHDVAWQGWGAGRSRGCRVGVGEARGHKQSGLAWGPQQLLPPLRPQGCGQLRLQPASAHSRHQPTAPQSTPITPTRGQLHGVAHEPAQQRVLELLCRPGQAKGGHG